jgi:hypothetical protein
MDPSALASDLELPGCPICRRVRETGFKILSRIQHSLSKEPMAQKSFARKRGLCPLHTWQMFSLASSEGFARGYASLAERFSMDLSRLARGARENGRDMTPLAVPDSQTCRVCRLLRNAEKASLESLARAVATGEGRRLYARSQGACLRHLCLLIQAGLAWDTSRFLLGKAAEDLNKCAEDMRGYAEKRAALRRDLITHDEENASFRILIHIVGEKNVP